MQEAGSHHVFFWSKAHALVCACDAQRKLFPLTDINGNLHVSDAEQMLLKLTTEM